jgi:glyoxylase-like metal-dependent hydrolase (beta-lactamase superfamily II)
VKDKQCLLIDPADSADFILEEISRRNLNVVGLVATHGHFDHVMAVGEIQMSLKGRRESEELHLHINKKDEFLIKRLGETARYFLGYEPTVIPITSMKDLPEGEVTIGDFSFQVIYTPGHTPGSVCLYFPHGVVFTGDTLFQNAIGRYDFKYSDKHELKKSLDKLLELPEETIVYPGHGAETTIGAEKLNKDHFFFQYGINS